MFLCDCEPSLIWYCILLSASVVSKCSFVNFWRRWLTEVHVANVMCVCVRWMCWKDSVSRNVICLTQWTVKCGRRNDCWRWRTRRSRSLSWDWRQWSRQAMMARFCGASRTSNENVRMPSVAVWQASTLHHSSPAEQASLTCLVVCSDPLPYLCLATSEI